MTKQKANEIAKDLSTEMQNFILMHTDSEISAIASQVRYIRRKQWEKAKLDAEKFRNENKESISELYILNVRLMELFNKLKNGFINNEDKLEIKNIQDKIEFLNSELQYPDNYELSFEDY